MSSVTELKFIVDQNSGKMVRWLRLMGFDTIFFTGENDSEMLAAALDEDRIIITRDTHILERRVITGGQVRAVLLNSDAPEDQIRQIVDELKLDESRLKLFTRCLEDNTLLLGKSKEEVESRVPPYVFKTQTQYMECPRCGRIYWRGTHWKSMNRKLERLKSNK